MDTTSNNQDDDPSLSDRDILLAYLKERLALDRVYQHLDGEETKLFDHQGTAVTVSMVEDAAEAEFNTDVPSGWADDDLTISAEDIRVQGTNNDSFTEDWRTDNIGPEFNLPIEELKSKYLAEVASQNAREMWGDGRAIAFFNECEDATVAVLPELESIQNLACPNAALENCGHISTEDHTWYDAAVAYLRQWLTLYGSCLQYRTEEARQALSKAIELFDQNEYLTSNDMLRLAMYKDRANTR